MKGYFGIGVEGISKAVNIGTLFRTAHAFGASFVFTVRAQYNRREGGQADTSDTPRSVPTYHFAGLEDFRLPFEQAGEHPFACTAHASGQMTVVVQATPQAGWQRLQWRLKTLFAKAPWRD